MRKTALAETDTIAARATPAGRGGIAIVRVSGAGVRELAKSLLGTVPAPRTATLARFATGSGEPIDTGLAIFFPAPRSFTGEDVLECQVHGAPVVCELLLARLVELGARLAGPGEFSRRAFLNDKLDLAQAEAIADLIDSGSRAAALAAQRTLRGEFSAAVLDLNEAVTALRVHVEATIDFPDDDIELLEDTDLRRRLEHVATRFDRLDKAVRQGCLLRDGIVVVLAGRPNAGKSSLLNALAGYEAAIVTAVAGTTRDIVRERLDLDGLPVQIADTAGLRAGAGTVEREGIRRARAELAGADHALVIIDASREADEAVQELFDELPERLGYTVVRNKVDLTDQNAGKVAGQPNWINVSALTGAGVDALREQIKQRVGFEDTSEDSIIARARHLESLRTARAHFDASLVQLDEHRAVELVAEELLQVQNALAEITGESSSDELLGRIFASFCIGK